MSKISLLSLVLSVFITALAVGDTFAQQGTNGFGPVVNAYLTALSEELNELEYQLNHNEIKREDYDRAKRRLTILKRYVEKYASGSREDLVPEYQVLADDELSTLGISRAELTGDLYVGQILNKQWRLIGIEPGRLGFMVFELVLKTKAQKTTGGNTEDISGSLDVIETIVIREPGPFIVSEQPLKDAVNDKEIGTGQSGDMTKQISVPETAPVFLGPKIIHIYLPQYTDKARNNGTQGDIVVSAMFQADGRVKDIKIEKGLGFGLDQRAIESVRRIGYYPAQRDGVDVDTVVSIIFTFSKGKVSFYMKSPESDGM